QPRRFRLDREGGGAVDSRARSHHLARRAIIALPSDFRGAHHVARMQQVPALGSIVVPVRSLVPHSIPSMPKTNAAGTDRALASPRIKAGYLRHRLDCSEAKPRFHAYASERGLADKPFQYR